MPSRRRPFGRTIILRCDDVVDDETLHPGVMVWLDESGLGPEELARFGRRSRGDGGGRSGRRRRGSTTARDRSVSDDQDLRRGA